MERFKMIIRKIFFLSPLPTVIIAVLGYASVILVAALHVNIPALQYISYVASAYALIITITGFPHFISFGRSVKHYMREHPITKKILGTRLGKRFFGDVRFRSDLSLYKGFFINLLYIAMKMFSGIYYRSVWFIALAIYYILLAVMRFVLIYRGKNKANKSQDVIELYRYRLCGIMLLLMNQALAGIVIFMVHQNRGFDYPGLLIYAMALYSFYSVIAAVVRLVKFRKHGSPVMSASKAINLVAAMVSILSLETAMMAQFGGDDDPLFRKAMTGATGGGVCTIVIGMAVYMIWRATKMLKKLQINNSET